MDRLTQLLTLALTATMAYATWAAEGEQKKKGRPGTVQRADPVTVDERVADARAIFVGEPMRIYFVDYRYREIAYIRAAGYGTARNAMMVVKVKKVLHAPPGDFPAQVLVPVYTTRDVFNDGPSPYDRMVERYVGKQAIWLGEVVTIKHWGDDKNPQPLEDPVVTFQARSADGQRRVFPTPYDIRRLNEISDTIARVKAGPKPPAPPAPPLPPSKGEGGSG